ncbi:MAG: sensor histidine kinase [Pseudomonadota bacterium]
MALHHQTLPGSTWRPMRGPFARWPRTSDTVLAIVVFLWSIFVTDETPNQDLAIRAVGDVPIAALFVYAVSSGALYWRRCQPLIVLGVNLAALAVLMGLGYPNSLWAMPFALYSAGRYATDDQWNYIGVGGALALSMISFLVDGEPAGNIGFGLVFVFLIWYIGRYIRIRGDYLRLLQERAVQLEQEQDSEARRAVAEERTRIARELHDVVAHRVSLMTVQAGAAKTVAADDPEGALQAMQAVEKAGRQALDELRHLMGVLRPEAEVDGLGPQPGLADVPRLVEHLREAGLEVSLTMDGVQTDLPARVDLSAYRIVQEALTNVLKHAGPSARTEVRLSTDSHGVAIEVLDNGHGATILPGSGHGIVGMRERALLLGGSLDAGPRPGGGFRVAAHLPIREEPI